MSDYRKDFDLGQFGLRVTSNNTKLVEDFDNYHHPMGDKQMDDILSLRIEDNATKLETIKKMLECAECSYIKGYMKTPLKHIETDDAIINYDEKMNAVVLKNKADGAVEIVLDSETSSKFESLPMYIAREMIIRKNENLGNIILHSASVFYDNKAYAIVGGPGAGKTSLLLGLLKANDGKVAYVSNDINFVTPDLRQIYPFQIPMLLSDATADSYFGDDKATIMKETPIISYFHSKDQEMITKFKIDRKSVEELFAVNSLSEATFGGILVPSFQRNKKGFSVEVIDKKFAKELIDGQVLDGDDRFEVDYLGLKEGNYKKTDYVFDTIVDNSPIVCVKYGKDIFEKENIDGIAQIFKFLRRSAIANFELHCHTTASDGRVSPKALIDRAVADEIDTLAITDHNTMDGYLQARDYINNSGIAGLDLISGVELDAGDLSCLHVLGYGIKDVDKMREFLSELQSKNDAVYVEMIDRLSNSGVDISVEKVLTTFGAKKLSKQLIGNYLIKNNYATNTTEVTQKYLGKHCVAYVPRVQPTIKKCIDFIHECGGLAVLAHPMELMKYNSNLSKEQDILDFVSALQKQGLDGVECCTGKHTFEQQDMLMTLCDRLGLVKTIGNDFHGKDLQELGTDETSIIEEFKLALSNLERVM